jgi:hypothetical protein
MINIPNFVLFVSFVVNILFLVQIAGDYFLNSIDPS